MTRATEAKVVGVDFTFGDRTYHVPPQDDWPIDLAELVEDGKYIAAARTLLGPDQWAVFKQHHRMGDVEPFFDALGDAVGANPTS